VIDPDLNPERERRRLSERRCHWARGECRNDHAPGSRLCPEHDAAALGPPRPPLPPRPCSTLGCTQDAAQPNPLCFDHFTEKRDREHLQRLVGAVAPVVEVIDAEGNVYEIVAPDRKPRRRHATPKPRPTPAPAPPRRPATPPEPCSVEGCDRPRRKKGMCTRHYDVARARAAGVPPRVTRMGCTQPDCDRKHYAHGLCQRHYDIDARLRAATGQNPTTERTQP
jgi:hypothetical protein